MKKIIHCVSSLNNDKCRTVATVENTSIMFFGHNKGSALKLTIIWDKLENVHNPWSPAPDLDDDENCTPINVIALFLLLCSARCIIRVNILAVLLSYLPFLDVLFWLVVLQYTFSRQIHIAQLHDKKEQLRQLMCNFHHHQNQELGILDYCCVLKCPKL